MNTVTLGYFSVKVNEGLVVRKIRVDRHALPLILTASKQLKSLHMVCIIGAFHIEKTRCAHGFGVLIISRGCGNYVVNGGAATSKVSQSTQVTIVLLHDSFTAYQNINLKTGFRRNSLL